MPLGRFTRFLLKLMIFFQVGPGAATRIFEIPDSLLVNTKHTHEKIKMYFSFFRGNDSLFSLFLQREKNLSVINLVQFERDSNSKKGCVT